MTTSQRESQIDALMEEASAQLVSMSYFEAERTCVKALRHAHEAGDYARMARITLPLQEARRQRAQLAMDAGCVRVIDDARRRLPEPGLYLVQPSTIAIEARHLREDAIKRRVPVLVLTREPLTAAGEWPIVAVNGEVSVRTRVRPPWALERVADSPTRDRAPGPPGVAWFMLAGEALGDAAIASLEPSDHPRHQIEDILEFLDCHPDHEKLHQALERACRAAITAGEPPMGRRATRLAEDRWSRRDQSFA